MVVVAVAGGTGAVGRTILEALLAQGKHEIKILSRERDPAKEKELGAPIIVADYANVASLTRTLEDNNVHTLISALNMMPSNVPEPNLIKAADASKTTRRMVSSDYGMPQREDEAHMLESITQKKAAWAELLTTKDLEWTVFHNGLFMDYFGVPKIKSYMQPWNVVIDLANNAASIPGSGNTKVVLTHTTDIAKFVAASLDLDKWDHVSLVIGDRLTWNEFVQMAEEAKGTKFKVAYDSVEKLSRMEVTELPGHLATYPYMPKPAVQAMLATFGFWFDRGDFDLDGSKALNKRLPEIKTLTIKELLEKAWKN